MAEYAKTSEELELESELSDAIRRRGQLLAEYANRVQEVRALLEALKASQAQISQLIGKRDGENE